MSRPSFSEERKRDRRITVRFTAAEYLKLKRLLEETEHESLASFVANAALGAEITERPKVPEVNAFVVDAMKQCLRAMRGIEANINVNKEIDVYALDHLRQIRAIFLQIKYHVETPGDLV